MSKAYTWEQVDQLAVEWYELPEEGNEAVKKSLEEKIFCASLELLQSPAYKNKRRVWINDACSVDVVDALGEFWLTDWQHFDPSRSPMSQYLKNRLDRRARDLNRQDNDLRKKKIDGEFVMVSNDSLDDDENYSRAANVRDQSAETAFEDIFLDERAFECLALILELPVRLNGKRNNPDTINYYRLFFTDGVVNYIRSNSGKLFFTHEQELFQAMRLPFLDYFLQQICRSVPDISKSHTKPYGELVEGRPMEPTKQPLPNDVYSVYLSCVEDHQAGDSAISQQRTAYRNFLRKTLC